MMGGWSRLCRQLGPQRRNVGRQNCGGDQRLKGAAMLARRMRVECEFGGGENLDPTQDRKVSRQRAYMIG